MYIIHRSVSVLFGLDVASIFTYMYCIIPNYPPPPQSVSMSLELHAWKPSIRHIFQQLSCPTYLLNWHLLEDVHESSESTKINGIISITSPNSFTGLTAFITGCHLVFKLIQLLGCSATMLELVLMLSLSPPQPLAMFWRTKKVQKADKYGSQLCQCQSKSDWHLIAGLNVQELIIAMEDYMEGHHGFMISTDRSR